MVRITVVGGGLAGLSYARSLRRLCPEVTNLSVFESRSSLHNPNHHGLGIWRSAQQCLTKMGIPIDPKASNPAQRFKYIRPAYYRSSTGHALSRASHDSAMNRAVVSIRQHHLLDMLADLTDESNSSSLRHFLSFNKSITSVVVPDRPSSESEFTFDKPQSSAPETSTAPLQCTLFDGSQHETDFLIFASHNHEPNFREQFMPTLKTTRDPFIVVSGIVSAKSFDNDSSFAWDFQPFETLYNRHRIAVVPLPNDELFWFAHIYEDDWTKYFPSNPSLEIPIELRQDENNEGLTQSKVLDVMAWKIFPSNAVHSEIQDVLRATEASQNIVAYSPSYISYRTPPKTAVAANGRILFLGDSIHSLPLNLAQNGTMAIENGFFAASAMASVFNKYANEVELESSLLSNKDFRSDLDLSLAKFDSERLNRYKTARNATIFTQALTRTPDGIRQTIRDGIRFVPPPINSLVFDQVLKYSFKNGALF